LKKRKENEEIDKEVEKEDYHVQDFRRQSKLVCGDG
jgi:hypothetical protein